MDPDDSYKIRPRTLDLGLELIGTVDTDLKQNSIRVAPFTDNMDNNFELDLKTVKKVDKERKEKVGKELEKVLERFDKEVEEVMKKNGFKLKRKYDHKNKNL